MESRNFRRFFEPIAASEPRVVTGCTSGRVLLRLIRRVQRRPNRALELACAGLYDDRIRACWDREFRPPR
jgi:hypothetical protein